MTAEKLKQIVEDRGIKQTWIATKLGVTKVSVNQWLNGTSTIPETRIEEIKKLLGV